MSRLRWDAGAVPLIARVEWRSERRHAERPVALWVAGERMLVTVDERWVEGPATAGAELVQCFVVCDDEGRTYLVRHGSRSATVVVRAS